MSLSYVVVSIERASREDVAVALEQYLAPLPTVGPLHCGRLRFEIVDRTEEIEFAKQFLEEHKLADANPIWRELNSGEFRIDVEVHAPQDERTSVPKEVMGDALARFISLCIGVRTALSINNGYVPFGIYANGEKCHDYARQYSHCFAGCTWLPSSLAHPVDADD